MECSLSEEDLWSGIDRQSPEVADHLASCKTCRTKADQFRAGIEAVSTASTLAPPPLPSRIGPYAIRRRLGAGGMGIVYEGQQPAPKRLVAIKVARESDTTDPYRVRLFQREAHTLARLKHPFIAPIYEAGQTEDGQNYFAMELVRGVPLNEYVRAHRIPRPRRLELFRKICDAIYYAHQRGVIHQDLKPTNILVDLEGNPKILDFGLARITDPESALTTIVPNLERLLGTLPYMSPEAARGNPSDIDVRSDVYSLGVILYELLTEHLPYTVKRSALHLAVRVICEQQPPRPSHFDRSLRGDLDNITLKALEKEPERRYQSSTALAEDVTRYLTDQPILARRAGLLYRARKFLVRHKLFFTFSLASILIISAARLWLDRLEAGRRSSTVMLIDNQALAVAVMENKLAEVLHEQGRDREAEPHYRNALATFRRLGRSERAGPILIVLARLITQHGAPSAKEYEDAESFLLEALAMFDAQPDPAEWIPSRRQALQALLALYRSNKNVWNDPKPLAADIEAELKALDSAPSKPKTPIK